MKKIYFQAFFFVTQGLGGGDILRCYQQLDYNLDCYDDRLIRKNLQRSSHSLLFQHFSGGPEKNHEKFFSIAGDPTKI
jgi:hypothetical protein